MLLLILGPVAKSSRQVPGHCSLLSHPVAMPQTLQAVQMEVSISDAERCRAKSGAVLHEHAALLASCLCHPGPSSQHGLGAGGQG